MNFAWQQVASDGAARAGMLHTAHGSVQTPVFMPVGTAGTVKAMTSDAVRSTGASIVLGNTYHLMLRPGAERVAALGGLHKFMDWPGPILTDSGGFQVMSLGALRKLDEDGVTFRSHIDGSPHRLTPENAMHIQDLLDATITMVLDECTKFPATHAEAEASMKLSMRWAGRARAAFRQRDGYALFGILQGGIYEDLRAASAAALTDIGFDGYAIGGLAVGEGQDAMFDVLRFIVPFLPAAQPRYLMGVGTPDDLLECLSRGVDMFDCVMPTRAGRHGLVFTRHGRMNLRNARYADDPRPIDGTSSAMAGREFSRAYWRHLVKSGEILAMMALTAVNLAYFQDLMDGARTAIQNQRLSQYIAAVKSGWTSGEIEGA